MATLAVGITVWQTPRLGHRDTGPVADIVLQSDVIWASSSTALQMAMWSLLDDCKTRQVRSRFNSVRAQRCESPAPRRSTSIRRCSCTSIAAKPRHGCQKSSKGFAIKTPEAKVVDQGTEFGVAARDDGKTDVVVFEGKVDVGETGRGCA